MTTTLELNVNGARKTVTTESERRLLDVLREDLNLTGCKYGCGEGQCRACTVLLDGRPVQSCLTPVTAAKGRTVLTIEGLADGDKLHPVQQAFLNAAAMQCGYCVPGMILSTLALLQDNPNPSEEETATALQGNLCRCCGYPNILNAVRLAAQQLAESPDPPTP